jgi:hypothetical protein
VPFSAVEKVVAVVAVVGGFLAWWNKPSETFLTILLWSE